MTLSKLACPPNFPTFVGRYQLSCRKPVATPCDAMALSNKIYSAAAIALLLSLVPASECCVLFCVGIAAW